MRQLRKLVPIGMKIVRKLGLQKWTLRILRENKSIILKALGEHRPLAIPPVISQLGAGDESVVSSRLIAEMLESIARGMPVSNGSAYYKKIPLNIAIVTDVYMYNFYKDTFNEVFYLTPTNYRECFDTADIDLFFYVSCWKGLNNEEWRGVKFRKQPMEALDAILEICKRKGVKTIFQTIEDPSNFDYFLPLAVKFDHIFTSASEMVDRYKDECGHERVYYGEYGVNPLLNNPIGCRRLSFNAPFFAGSYPRRYKERCEDMEVIFDSIVATGQPLVIADRNFGSTSEDVKYPGRFDKYVIPPIEHERLQSVHKLFRHNLNFNSIKDSPTMCAMRIYELQAQGKGILSNYANSLFNKFPNVRIVPHAQDLSHELNAPETIEEYASNMASVRNVLNDKTSFDILSGMLSKVGFQLPEQQASLVCVLCEKVDENIKASFDRQKYKDKLLVSIGDVALLGGWESFSEYKNIRFIAWFCSAEQYGDHYLEDMINCFKFTASTYVSKLAYFDRCGLFVEGPQHEYTEIFGGRERSVLIANAANFQFVTSRMDGEPAVMTNGYAADPFQYNSPAGRSHFSESECVELSIVIPIFNNGKFLLSKCIPSLQRNHIWNKMEVILVDDGSTDIETVAICQRLERENGNIKYYSYGDGGSGSASRPRNKGVALATAPLISFLDPDNEISPGGYDALVSIYNETNSTGRKIDFVSGYHVKVAGASVVVGKHSSVRASICSDFHTAFFNKGKFPVISTQAAVLSKALFVDPAFRFVENAAGQDTLFGWELLCRSSAGVFTNSAHLIYYAEREGSVTNTIDASYFEKKMILEREQVKILKKYNLFELYMDFHFERFMEGWYLPKLSSVLERDLNASKKILSDIVRLYGVSPEKYNLKVDR